MGGPPRGAGPGSRGTVGNKGNTTRLGRKGGEHPVQPPSGCTLDVIDLCEEAPLVGHIKVQDLTYLLRLGNHRTLNHLQRSIRGYVSMKTALREVERRELGIRMNEVYWDPNENQWTWDGRADAEEEYEHAYEED